MLVVLSDSTRDQFTELTYEGLDDNIAMELALEVPMHA